MKYPNVENDRRRNRRRRQYEEIIYIFSTFDVVHNDGDDAESDQSTIHHIFCFSLHVTETKNKIAKCIARSRKFGNTNAVRQKNYKFTVFRFALSTHLRCKSRLRWCPTSNSVLTATASSSSSSPCRLVCKINFFSASVCVSCIVFNL